MGVPRVTISGVHVEHVVKNPLLLDQQCPPLNPVKEPLYATSLRRRRRGHA